MHGLDEGQTFVGLIGALAKAYKSDQKTPPQLKSQCKKCEFRIGSELKSEGLKSGFEECWQQAAGLSAADLAKPLVFDVWKFLGAKKLIEDRRYFMAQIEEDDINPKPHDEDPGLSQSERQWKQVQKVTENDPTHYFDAEAMRAEMASWTYPLHFIDFETSTVAIPFHRGRRPYEQIAFQFSHHLVTKNGQITHQTEYINGVPGQFPNFEFVRQLRQALSGNQGTIFRYTAHENTVLCQIHEQLKTSEEADREELMAWIRTITHATKSIDGDWTGARDMVDLWELAKRYYYHPLTEGSISIKDVLPAILQTSEYLQKLYGQSNYGAAGGVGSKNFKDWQWIQKDAQGQVMDPYKLLPPVFADLTLEELDSLLTEDSLSDGGAAMTAYMRMQFTQMSETERERVCRALLKYCELDTLAMVMIVQYWENLLAEAPAAANGERQVISGRRPIAKARRPRAASPTKKKIG